MSLDVGVGLLFLGLAGILAVGARYGISVEDGDSIEARVLWGIVGVFFGVLGLGCLLGLVEVAGVLNTK